MKYLKLFENWLNEDQYNEIVSGGIVQHVRINTYNKLIPYMFENDKKIVWDNLVYLNIKNFIESFYRSVPKFSGSSDVFLLSKIPYNHTDIDEGKFFNTFRNSEIFKTSFWNNIKNKQEDEQLKYIKDIAFKGEIFNHAINRSEQYEDGLKILDEINTFEILSRDELPGFKDKDYEANLKNATKAPKLLLDIKSAFEKFYTLEKFYNATEMGNWSLSDKGLVGKFREGEDSSVVNERLFYFISWWVAYYIYDYISTVTLGNLLYLKKELDKKK
jgi:hypothetical protein